MERKWAIIIAAVLGLLAVFLTNIYFRQQKTQVPVPVREAQVLVAAKDISRGATIDYDMLAFKMMPLNFIQPRALTSKESAVGKTALATIMASEQILVTKLAAPGAGLTLAGKTPPGKRAVTINLEAASAVGGMIRPADHVDVLAIFSAPAITLTLFQDVLVLAVGQEMVPTEEKKERTRVGREATSTARRTVTLALTPQQVQILTVAIEQGKIRLTLRPRMETGEALPAVDLSNLPPAIDLNTLLQFYIRRPEAAPSVEVIRGLKKEVTPVPAK
ncbi:MAG: Flp pilus assembly protein CpaB [Candidatus Omnitrophica bacterium]|nr:Flp pilus assembly protein CpaB [Candidatus Omnitrophota bacterium]MBU4141170.1 Flp pilus assembly protein CpaB [Candidatus Omnitrophota bacterium]